MSVIVKGLEMPKQCGGCPLRGNCKQRIYIEYRPKDCPMVELPPHGRLADLDEMIEDYWDGKHMEIDEDDLKAISQYKVVIEAEGSET